MVALAAVVTSALAGGAPSIAAAPSIPLSQQQVNAVVGIDYWRVQLRAGDRLTVEYGPQKNYSYVEV